MKALNLLLIISFLLVGCRSTKKLVESSAVISNQTETVQKFDIKEGTKVNNDKLTEEETVTTITEYFAPSETVTNTTNEPIVKSVTVKVSKKKEVDKGRVETAKADNSQVATKTESKSDIQTKVVEKKTVPIQWGWIFAVLALITGVVLYFTKPKFLTVIFAFIKKLFV